MIQVGFSRANGFWSFLSKMIMYVTGRPFSHCWLLCTGSDGYKGKDLVLTEDEHGGLHFVPWLGYGNDKTIVVLLNSPYDLSPGLESLLDLLGTGYDYAGLAGEGWVVAMKRWFHRRVKNPFASPSRMWCSECVYRALLKVPQFNIPSDASDDVDPGTLYDTIISAGGKVVNPQ